MNAVAASSSFVPGYLGSVSWSLVETVESRSAGRSIIYIEQADDVQRLSWLADLRILFVNNIQPPYSSQPLRKLSASANRLTGLIPTSK